jgi:hypothetical protein
MTKAITHLLDNESNPVCDIKRKNIGGTNKRELATCPKCQFIGPRRVLDLKTLNKEVDHCVQGLFSWKSR